MIEISHLQKSFKKPGIRNVKVEVLRDISLTIDANMIFSIIGPNGAGKSTTLKILMGFLRPTVNVDVQLSDVVAIDSFRFTFAGKSMGAGVEGSARTEVSDEGTKTLVKMEGTVETTGLLKKVSDSKTEAAVSGFLDNYFTSVERANR